MNKTAPQNSLLAVLIAVVLLFIGAIIVNQPPNCPESEVCRTILASFLELELNEMGDALAGIFSSLAFIAAIAALWFQRSELELTRNELNKSATALGSQVKILEQRERGEHLEELLVGIRNESAFLSVSWVFERREPQIFSGSTESTLSLEETDFSYKKIEEIIPELTVFLHIFVASLEREGDRGTLVNSPSPAFYRPNRMLGYVREINQLMSQLSPAKRSRLRNLGFENLEIELEKFCSEEWWLKDSYVDSLVEDP